MIVLTHPDVLGELVDRGRVAALARSPGPAVENRLHGQREVGIPLVILETIQRRARDQRRDEMQPGQVVLLLI